MPHIVTGRPLTILLLLEGRETGLYPRAVVKDEDRAVVATVPLASEGDGVYSNISIPMAGTFMTAEISIYEDAGFTTLSRVYPDPLAQVFTSSADLASLARIKYDTKFSTVLNSTTGVQEVLVWAEKDGRTVSGTNCTIAIKNSLGATVWSGSQAMPNADGVFRFTNSVIATADANYYINISIDVDAEARLGRQVFVTVG